MKLKAIEEVDRGLCIDNAGQHTTVRSNSTNAIGAKSQKKNIIGADSISVNPTRIGVFGIGGGGVNAINHMIQSGLDGVTMYAANTDVQTLDISPAENILPLGQRTCRGLGVGGNPERGAECAREVTGALEELISQYDMIFLASGFGGGTGTGATPVIAEIARDLGVLTVGVVTMPFSHEGEQRMKNAVQGLEEIEALVDALIVIPNDNILSNDVISPDSSIDESFTMINKILSDAVSAITDIITVPGRINVDFADIEACLRSAGRVSIGIGYAEAHNEGGGSAHRATDIALKNKIIDKENSMTLQRAEKVIINVIAGPDVSVPELLAIPNIVSDRVKGMKPTLKFGYRVEQNWGSKVGVTIIASSPQGTGGDKNVFSTTHSLKTSARNSQFSFADKSTPEDVAGKYVDSDMFSRLTNITIDGEKDSLSCSLESDELDDPALERLVGISSDGSFADALSLKR